MSLRDKILQTPLAEKSVDVPAWGVTVLVREVTGAQSMKFERLVAAGDSDAVGHMVIACTFDPETGQPVFTPADAEAVGALGMRGLTPILEAAKEVSGLDANDIEKAKALFENAR